MKITMIGAGSLVFTRGAVRDILSVPELTATEIALTDISEQNLDMAYQLIKRDIEAAGIAAKVTATLDRREAVRGANYVYSTARVGGLEGLTLDIEIPLKYGVSQFVGDTLCVGGIMYAQRTIPVLLEFCRDIKELAAADCLFINHSNPMAMNMWAVNKYGGGVRNVGLCHGVQYCLQQIADALGLPMNELDIVCAGINHQAWYISVKHNGVQYADKLLGPFERHPELSKSEKVRIDMIRRFGYYSTESNGHLSEYLPWYRKRLDEIDLWRDTEVELNGETAGYLRYCVNRRNWFIEEFPKLMQAPPEPYGPGHRGGEHGSFIIEALETGRVYRGHFNVPNGGIITNLPADCIIEAPGYMDYNGFSMPVVGGLPMGCAAVCNATVSVQRLAMEAAVSGEDVLLRQAMLMDPLVGAVCNPPEVWRMVDELLVAEAEWLPQYGKAIEDAKRRLG